MTNVLPMRPTDRNGDPRRMPVNLEAEQALLAAILLDNNCWQKVAHIIEPKHFHEPLHARVMEVILALVEAGKTANPITCRTYLGDEELAPGITPGKYLAHLVSGAIGAGSVVKEYAEMVRELAARRASISSLMGRVDELYDAPPDMPVGTILDGIEGDVAEVRSGFHAGSNFAGYEDYNDVLDRAVQKAGDGYQRGGAMVGLSTGLERLDEALGGLHPGELTIIAGRPGMAKTALAMLLAMTSAFALRARRKAGERVGTVVFHSLEMPNEQLAMREIAGQSKVSGYRVRQGKINAAEFERFADAARSQRDLPLILDASPGLRLAQMAQRLRNRKKRGGLALVVIDYLQLMPGSGKNERGNRNQEITEITAGLKTLAKELSVPIVALSQLSRDVEKRDDKRPMLADLRDSGAIEQDADAVLFIYREEYYLGKQEPRPGTEEHIKWQDRMDHARGVAEIIIGKNRHGPDCSVTVGFESAITRFVNDPPEREAPQSRDRKAQVKDARKAIPARAIIAHKELVGLIAREGISSSGLEGVEAGVRCISYEAWRKRCAEEILDPDDGDKDEAKLMREVITPLRAADLIKRGGSKDGGWFVWLTSKGSS